MSSVSKLKKLSTVDLKAVVKALLPISNKWYDLGLEFDICADTLDNIKTSHQDNVERLRECLKIFLKQVDPAPTWKVIVEALSEPTIGNPQLARQLEEQYLLENQEKTEPTPSKDQECGAMAAAPGNDKQYFTILLIGKTGLGKSTTGNKLLRINEGRLSSAEKQVNQWTSKIISLLKRCDDDEKVQFQTGDGQTRDSVTKQCQLLSNEALGVRVLDVPGFADSDAAYSLGVYEANLSLFRRILRVQIELNLKFDRVVYFFPQRGAPEKADSNIQEELKIMYYFFGPVIFDTMIIIATNHHRKQKYGFDEDDEKDMRSVVTRSLQLATRSQDSSFSITPDCPPIVYLGLDDTGEEILAKLKSAPVINQSGLVFKFCDTVCARCAVNIRFAEHAATSKTSVALKRVGITDKKGVFKDDKTSLCHPIIIPKHSRLEKILGGVIHIMSFGIVYAIGKISQDEAIPFFSNTDEICPACGQPPGAKGCQPVGIDCRVAWHGSPFDIHVDHTNKVDDIKVLERDQSAVIPKTLSTIANITSEDSSFNRKG